MQGGHVGADVFEVAMAYVAGNIVAQAACNALAAENPPVVDHGFFQDFAREIPKYERGTAFMTLGTVLDIAEQRFEATLLFYDSPSQEDHSILRFAFHAPGAYKSDKPSWQDPNYGTALSIAEASRKLVLAVDAFDVLLAPGEAPPDAGFKFEVDDVGFAIREVTPAGAAAKAGLQVGDRIVTMNRARVTTPADYLRGRGVLAETRRLELGIRRGTEELAVSLVASG